MSRRQNYYERYNLAADYSRPEPVSDAVGNELIQRAAEYINQKEPTLPAIDPSYPLTRIEQENKDWWPTHCEALRRANDKLLNAEYRNAELVYLCADGPYLGTAESTPRESEWWKLISRPEVIMAWPIVMFSGEVVYFEWSCFDRETREVTAKGNVTWIRRGHRGACYLKTEQLTFYRDVYGPPPPAR